MDKAGSIVQKIWPRKKFHYMKVIARLQALHWSSARSTIEVQKPWTLFVLSSDFLGKPNWHLYIWLMLGVIYNLKNLQTEWKHWKICSFSNSCGILFFYKMYQNVSVPVYIQIWTHGQKNHIASLSMMLYCSSFNSNYKVLQKWTVCWDIYLLICKVNRAEESSITNPILSWS